GAWLRLASGPPCSSPSVAAGIVQGVWPRSGVFSIPSRGTPRAQRPRDQRRWRSGHHLMNEPCILLVEDSPPHATVAKYALAVGGVRVEHCATLAAALERLADKTGPPLTAVVLDLTLPDASGTETFDRGAAAGAPAVGGLSGGEG